MAKEISAELMLLFDLYSPLLSEKKREAFEYYYCDDLSLAEIAEIQGISRQAVLESIRGAEKKLDDCEKKLGFREKTKSVAEISKQISSAAHEIPGSSRADADAKDRIISLCSLLGELYPEN